MSDSGPPSTPIYCDRCGYDISASNKVCPECGLEVSVTHARQADDLNSTPGIPEAPYHRFTEPIFLLGFASILGSGPALLVAAPMAMDMLHGNLRHLGHAIGLVMTPIPAVALIWWSRNRAALLRSPHDRQRTVGRVVLGASVVACGIVLALLWHA